MALADHAAHPSNKVYNTLLFTLFVKMWLGPQFWILILNLTFVACVIIETANVYHAVKLIYLRQFNEATICNYKK